MYKRTLKIDWDDFLMVYAVVKDIAEFPAVLCFSVDDTAWKETVQCLLWLCEPQKSKKADMKNSLPSDT